MITPTYFGEITELDSRAVWYSDEEDEEEDDEDLEEPGLKATSISPMKGIGTITHDSLKESVQAIFDTILWHTDRPYSRCIISQSSQSKFAHFRLNPLSNLQQIGSIGACGKAFSLTCLSLDQNNTPASEEKLLWLLFDASSCYTNGHQACYFVECLLDTLFNKFNLIKSNHLLIISRQFSTGQGLEYLNNYENPSVKLPFVGRHMSPPHLIRNQFESALFEQSTLLLNPAIIICLPDPKSYWFDRANDWPAIPNEIIELKLNDDNLEKTLIFT